MRIHFKKCYATFIMFGEKKTTCRLGDKSNRFKVGDKLELYVGSRYKPYKIAEAVITKVKVKQFKDITEQDLEFESPDCRTVDGLYCTMYHINNVLLKGDDIVTLISWNHVKVKFV